LSYFSIFSLADQANLLFETSLSFFSIDFQWLILASAVLSPVTQYLNIAVHIGSTVINMGEFLAKISSLTNITCILFILH